MLRDILLDHYNWLRAAHIIAVIAWMAGLLYLPRLFVYHTETQAGSAESARFKLMERRLLRGIMNPAMIAVWLLGLTMAWLSAAQMHPWFHLKFALVIAMSGVHGFLAGCRGAFAADRNTRSARFYRIINEVPAVLMVLIVILVVVKPFG